MDVRAILLYDDECGLCRAGSARLVNMARRGAVEREPVQSERGRQLAAEAGVSEEQCRAAMQLIVQDSEGKTTRVYAGPDAVAAMLATRHGLGWLPRAARRPGVRLVLALVYQWIARRRLRLSRLLGLGTSETSNGSACENGACGIEPFEDKRS